MNPQAAWRMHVRPENWEAWLAYQRGERTPTTRAANAEYHRSYRRTSAGQQAVRNMNLRKYGLTEQQYQERLVAQDGGCAACGQPETHHNQRGLVSLAVDHDPLTGRVRGILCMSCNRSLGLLQDDPERVRLLLEYRLKVGDAR